MNGLTSHPTEYKWAFPEVMVVLASFGTTPFSTLAQSPWYYLGRYGNPDKNCYTKQYTKWEKGQKQYGSMM